MFNLRGGASCPSLNYNTMNKDTKEKSEAFSNGYEEGYFMAAQQLASKILRLIDLNQSWMLEKERRIAKASIKLATKTLLQKRGIIPHAHDVIMGKAEDVPLDFNMDC